MPGPWDIQTEHQLLMTIIHLAMPKLPDWDKTAVMMGDAFTASACRQHFQKLRNECKQKFGEPGTAPTGTAAKGTPRAKPAASGAATTKGKAKASMKKGKASSSSSSKKRKERDEDMSDGSDEPVAKKVVKEEIEEPEELS